MYVTQQLLAESHPCAFCTVPIRALPALDVCICILPFFCPMKTKKKMKKSLEFEKSKKRSIQSTYDIFFDHATKQRMKPKLTLTMKNSFVF